ncbi:MAG: hypothetical protein H7831_14415, partial [Magnetococcus sp. WYHC-3]
MSVNSRRRVRTRWLAPAAVCAGMALNVAPARAVPFLDQGVEVTWPSAPPARVELRDNELLLVFATLQRQPELWLLPSTHPEWVQRVEARADSIRVVGRTGTRFDYYFGKGRVTLTIHPPAANATVPTAAASPRGQVRAEAAVQGTGPRLEALLSQVSPRRRPWRGAASTEAIPRRADLPSWLGIQGLPVVAALDLRRNGGARFNDLPETMEGATGKVHSDADDGILAVRVAQHHAADPADDSGDLQVVPRQQGQEATVSERIEAFFAQETPRERPARRGARPRVGGSDGPLPWHEEPEHEQPFLPQRPPNEGSEGVHGAARAFRETPAQPVTMARRIAPAADGPGSRVPVIPLAESSGAPLAESSGAPLAADAAVPVPDLTPELRLDPLSLASGKAKTASAPRSEEPDSAVPLAPAGLKVAVDNQPNSATVLLNWDRAVSFTPTISGQELLLRFSRPLPGGVLDGVYAQLPGKLADMRYGFDTLLLRAQDPRTTFQVTAEGTQTRIHLVIPEAVARADSQRDAFNQRMDFLRTRWDESTMGLRQSRGKLRELLDETELSREGNVGGEFIARMALTEERLGRWRHALVYYDRALKATPGEQNLIEAEARLRRAHHPRLDVGQSLRWIDDNHETWSTSTARVEWPLWERVTLRADANSADISTDRYVNAQGDGLAFSGRRTRGGVGLTLDRHNVDRVDLDLLGDDHGVGVGVGYSWVWVDHLVQLATAWNAPYWDLLVGTLDGGTEDRATLRWEGLYDEFRGQAALGLHRYGLDGDTGLVHASTYQLGVQHLTPLWNMALGYMVEGEALMDRETRLDATGATYAPLPLEGRESHTLSASLGDMATDYLSWRGSLGYSWERYTSQHGPALEAGLNWQPTVDFEVDLAARHTLSNQVAQKTAVNQIDARITMLF